MIGTIRTVAGHNQARIVVGIGIVWFAYGAYADSVNLAGDLRHMASILVIAGICREWCIRPACRLQDQIFATAYQQGLDQGWKAGHRAARPVVVPMHVVSDDEVAVGCNHN